MHRALLLLLVVTLAMLVAAPAGAKKRAPLQRGPAPPAYVVERLPDGLTLVHVKTKGPTVSMRYAVRVGGFSDPEERPGLAHLLEHLIFHGSYDQPEGRLLELARQQGAHVTARTSTVWTTYDLDAPKEAFLELMEPYVRLVTNPALQLADVERERRVVDVEDTYFGFTTLVWALDQLVFPSENRGRTVLGSKRTRDEIEPGHLLDFYAEHYTPANTVVVVVGDVATGDLHNLLERAVLQPPVPGVAAARPRSEPNVPASAKVRAPLTATATGYHLGAVDRRQCEDIAHLLELRVLERVQWSEPLASDVEVRCLYTRGESFVVAFALSKNPDGGRLPEILRQVMEGAARQPPSAKERSLITQRASSLAARQTANSALLADELSWRLLELDGSVEENLVSHFARPALDWKKMQPVMRRSLVPRQRVLVHLSPFEG